MENATQALLIAGGILFALLTLSILVFMFNNAGQMQSTQYTKEEAERLEKWNAEWEAYDKRILYGADVLTVLNKAKQNNIEFDNNALYIVNVEVKDEDNNVIPDTDVMDYIKARKTLIFTCERMQKNDETGRIQDIVFKLEE